MKISKTLAIALVNDDFSGLSDETKALAEKVNFGFVINDYADESNDINGVCEITGQYDCCVDVTPIRLHE